MPSIWILDVLLVLYDTLGNVFKRQDVQKIDRSGRPHVMTRAHYRYIRTRTCTIASNM
jgi:hypothetical protein